MIPLLCAKKLLIRIYYNLGVTEGLERSFNEDGKPGSLMVTVNKNGLPALHLAVPTSARSIGHTQGKNTVSFLYFLVFFMFKCFSILI